MSLGITEIVLIVIVVIVLFGGKKIPELARGLGKAQAEYKKAKETFENELNSIKAETAKPTVKAAPKTTKKATTKKTTSKPATAKKPAAKKVATKKTTKKSAK